MHSRVLLSMFGAVFMAGCGKHALVDTPVTHPANPDAINSPESPRSQTLREDATPAGTDASAADATTAPAPLPADHSHHHSDAIVPDAMKAMPGETVTPAQKPVEPKVSYTCSMHPEIHSDKPGNCPICGMKLVPEKK